MYGLFTAIYDLNSRFENFLHSGPKVKIKRNIFEHMKTIYVLLLNVIFYNTDLLVCHAAVGHFRTTWTFHIDTNESQTDSDRPAGRPY